MWTRWTHICANEDAEWSSHLWHGLIISYEVKDNLATIYKAASYSEKWESMSSQDVCAALLVTVKNWGYTAARGHESLNENLHTSHRIPPRSLQSNIGYYHCSWLLTITGRQDSLAEDITCFGLREINPKPTRKCLHCPKLCKSQGGKDINGLTPVLDRECYNIDLPRKKYTLKQ